MGQKTEFEEPEYEGPLYNQLLNGAFNLWTPGRRFERFFGIDAALFSKNSFFWSLFAQSTPQAGVVLNQHDWPLLLKIFSNHIRTFPSYDVNILIQSKRPKHRFGINSTYSKNGIMGQYWQFEVTKHQQKILEKLESKLGSKALVIYACPAFHKFSDLDSHTQNGQIIENSSFVKASALSSHHKWVFDKPGTSGLACSKIDIHSDISFKEMLAGLTNKSQGRLNDNPYKYLINVVNEICLEDEKNPILKAFVRRNKNLKEYLKSQLSLSTKEIHQGTIDFFSFAQFASTINIGWLTINE